MLCSNIKCWSKNLTVQQYIKQGGEFIAKYSDANFNDLAISLKINEGLKKYHNGHFKSYWQYSNVDQIMLTVKKKKVSNITDKLNQIAISYCQFFKKNGKEIEANLFSRFVESFHGENNLPDTTIIDSLYILEKLSYYKSYWDFNFKISTSNSVKKSRRLIELHRYFLKAKGKAFIEPEKSYKNFKIFNSNWKDETGEDYPESIRLQKELFCLIKKQQKMELDEIFKKYKLFSSKGEIYIANDKVLKFNPSILSSCYEDTAAVNKKYLKVKKELGKMIDSIAIENEKIFAKEEIELNRLFEIGSSAKCELIYKTKEFQKLCLLHLKNGLQYDSKLLEKHTQLNKLILKEVEKMDTKSSNFFTERYNTLNNLFVDIKYGHAYHGDKLLGYLLWLEMKAKSDKDLHEKWCK